MSEFEKLFDAINGVKFEDKKVRGGKMETSIT